MFDTSNKSASVLDKSSDNDFTDCLDLENGLSVPVNIDFDDDDNIPLSVLKNSDQVFISDNNQTESSSVFDDSTVFNIAINTDDFSVSIITREIFEELDIADI